MTTPELTVRWLSSGDVLGSFRAAELDASTEGIVTVAKVKRRLEPLVHQPRFKLKLLRGSDVLNDEELTLPETLQLVVLSRYQEMTREQMVYVLDAARHDVAPEMERFLQLPMDPDVSADGETALHCAAASGSVRCCRLLLEARASLELPAARYDDHRPLQVACRAGELEIVQQLLDAGADQYQVPTALHLASYHGAADIVRLLLAQRGKVDELDREHDATPLRLACQQRHLEVVRSLLEAKATANKACEDGSTPLLEAAQSGHLQISELLLKERGDPTLSESKATSGPAVRGFTMTQMAGELGHPLYIAAQNGNLALVTLLLQQRADPNQRCLDSATLGAPGVEMSTTGQPTGWDGHEAVLRALLERRADPNMTREDGAQALHMAAQENHSTVAKLLIEARAHVDSRASQCGSTPLYSAINGKSSGMVRFLLAAFADANCQCGDATPLLLAAQEQEIGIVKALIEGRADVNKANDEGVTALLVCAQEGLEEGVQLILTARGDPNKATDEGNLAELVDGIFLAAVPVLPHDMPSLTRSASDLGSLITPLHTAAEENYAEICQLLLSARAAVDPRNLRHGAAPLYMAAQNGHLEAVSLLLRARADPNLTCSEDDTPPLLMAAQEGYREADPDRGDVAPDGETPLTVVLSEVLGGERLELVQLLVEAKADPHQARPDGTTPLALAHLPSTLEPDAELAAAVAAAQDGEEGEAFQVRRIEFLGQEVPVLLQNRNGPCALLAIANGLLLRGSWNIGEMETSISSRDLDDFTLAQRVREVVSTMPKLLDGLLVNCDFGSCSSFQECSSTLVGTGLFKLFKLQLHHVWVDPEVHKVVPTWNDLQDLLAKAAEVQSLRSEKDLSQDDEELLTKAALMQEWWEANRAQSTERGIKELQRQVQTGEVCVLFRNNHFCTVYRPGANSPCPHLCTLLTDECFQGNASPVWETLTVEENQFLDSFFCPMEDLPPTTAGIAAAAGYTDSGYVNGLTPAPVTIGAAAEPRAEAATRPNGAAPAATTAAATGTAATETETQTRSKGIYNCRCGKYFTTRNGLLYIIRDDGSRVDLRFLSDKLRSNIDLQYGWRVERHMIDGDYVIFNRQPSLHKMSMMGHRAKVMPFSTLRFNLAVTSPYNADFDGDEMNLHLAQSHETRAEIKHMMLNPRQVVSPQGNKPVMGVVQDSLLATAKYTKRDTYMEKDLVMNILMWLPVWDGQLPPPAIMKPKMLWTGKQILSMLLPKTLSMKRDAAIASKNRKDEADFAASDCKVLIMNGELLSGIVCKKTIGSSSGSLLHLVWLDSGPEWCRNVLSYIQKMVNQWLTHNGFSCGVADIIANDQTLLNVEKTLKQAKNEVRNILADAQRGKLETQPGKTMYQSFEARVNQRLNAAREDAGNIGGSSLDERNNIISMVNAGSKGSPLNIAQIVACVGQQNVEGSRIRYGFNERTLPHFTKDDYGAEARGFVENSYLAGLTPQEVWMHAMGGREGVIDTACKTSETGYIQRRLVKSMETLKVAYDGTARNACNDIIQFLYGEDGMDGLWIEDQTLDIMTYDHKSLENNFQHKYHTPDYGLDWLTEEQLEEIRTSPQHQKLLDEEWERLKHTKDVICKEVFPDGDVKQHIPINITRLLDRARQRIHQEDGSRADERYSPVEVAVKVENLLKELEVTRAIAEGDTIGREVEDNAKVILNAHLRCALASRKIVQKEKLSKQSFDWLLGEVKQKANTKSRNGTHPDVLQLQLATFHLEPHLFPCFAVQNGAFSPSNRRTPPTAETRPLWCASGRPKIQMLPEGRHLHLVVDEADGVAFFEQESSFQYSAPVGLALLLPGLLAYRLGRWWLASIFTTSALLSFIYHVVESNLWPSPWTSLGLRQTLRLLDGGNSGLAGLYFCLLQLGFVVLGPEERASLSVP
eukprot:s59_g86.t2